MPSPDTRQETPRAERFNDREHYAPILRSVDVPCTGCRPTGPTNLPAIAPFRDEPCSLCDSQRTRKKYYVMVRDRDQLAAIWDRLGPLFGNPVQLPDAIALFFAGKPSDDRLRVLFSVVDAFPRNSYTHPKPDKKDVGAAARCIGQARLTRR